MMSNSYEQQTDLKCLTRIKAEIPVIKLGYECVTRCIVGLKESSTVIEWSFNKAASSVDQVIKYPLPYIKDQLLAIDQMMCTSLDLTELNLPVLTKSPQEIYEKSVEYVMAIVTPVTNWVDVEVLPSAEIFIDCYLPELNSCWETEQVNDEKSSRTCQLAVKLARRINQHSYAEPKYLGNLIYNGCRESILLMKMLINDPSLLLKTFNEIWKKIGNGVTPDEAANSLLLIEMGCIKLRNGASVVIKVIETSENMAKFFIEMFVRYVNELKNFVI